MGWMKRAQFYTRTQVRRRRPLRLLTASPCAPQLKCTLQKTEHQGAAATPTPVVPCNNLYCRLALHTPRGDGCATTGRVCPCARPRTRSPTPTTACSFTSLNHLRLLAGAHPRLPTSRPVRLPAC